MVPWCARGVAVEGEIAGSRFTEQGIGGKVSVGGVLPSNAINPIATGISVDIGACECNARSSKTMDRIALAAERNNRIF